MSAVRKLVRRFPYIEKLHVQLNVLKRARPGVRGSFLSSVSYSQCQYRAIPGDARPVTNYSSVAK
jgi:hypothetical protein